MSDIDFYDKNADDFVSSTVGLDMSEFYARFLGFLTSNPASILDAGCGSGRDAKYFKELGHTVDAFDAAAEVVARASDFLGQPVRQMNFQDMSFDEQFNAIWACASLLHVPKSEMHDVLGRCRRALKPDGIMYASFKHGVGEILVNGRRFNNYTEERLLSECFGTDSGFSVLDVWVTNDIRPDRGNESWVNVIVGRV